MSDSDTKEVLLALGKAQVDAMFRRLKARATDDSEFLPLLEAVLTAFETMGVDTEVVEELWEYAFAAFDQACKEAAPKFTTADNRKLMREHLLGPRGLKRKSRR